MELLQPNALNGYAKKEWYKLWVYIFNTFNVVDIVTIAIAIHRAQFILSCILIYFASFQIFQALLMLNNASGHAKNVLRSLSLCSVLVWLGIIGTTSLGLQQAWIMWYSVNYQLSLPMLMLAIGLVVNVLSRDLKPNEMIVKLTISGLLFLGVYLFHAGELAYMLFYLPILFICFGSRKYFFSKSAVLSLVIALAVIFLATRFYTDQVPALVTLVKNGEFLQIWKDISEKGEWNTVAGFNRHEGNWNELYKLSLTLASIVLIFQLPIIQKKNQLPIFKHKSLFFIILSLIFCFIPVFKYSAGLASVISYAGIVNRYYFASFIFLIVPMFVYIFSTNISSHKQANFIFFGSALIMLATFFYSKEISADRVYYHNVSSIVKSFRQHEVSFGSSVSIDSVKEQISLSEQTYGAANIMYCGNYDSMFIAYYIFNIKSIYYYHRMNPLSLFDCEQNALNNAKRVVYLK